MTKRKASYSFTYCMHMVTDIAVLILTFKLPHLNRSFARLLSIRIKRLINFDDDSLFVTSKRLFCFVCVQALQFNSSSAKIFRFSYYIRIRTFYFHTAHLIQQRMRLSLRAIQFFLFTAKFVYYRSMKVYSYSL